MAVSTYLGNWSFLLSIPWGPGRKPGTVIGSVSKITFTLLRRNYCWPYYAIFPKKIISVTLLPISSFLGEIFKFSRLSELPFSLNPPNRLSKSLPDSASRQLYARRRGFGRRQTGIGVATFVS